MNVLAIFHLGDTSGPSKSLDRELRDMAEGGRLEVLVPAEGTMAEEYRRFANVTVLPYTAATMPRGPLQALGDLARLQKDARLLARHIRRTRPDLVLVVTSVLPAALVAARLAGRPTVVYVSEILDGRAASPRPGRIARAALARVTARLAQVLVCSSPAVSAQFERARSSRVITLYPRIDRRCAEGRRRESRERWGVGESDQCLAVVGAISHGRGQDLAITALAHVRNRLPGAKLLIAGAPHPRQVDRRYDDDLRSLAARLGLQDSVRFLGFVHNVADVYAAADVVINPARVDEAFGRVAAEALTALRPVVATRVGAIPEVLRAEVDAVLVPSGDALALADAIVRLVTDGRRRARLVASGRRRIDELCNAEASVAGMTVAAAAALGP